MNGQIGHVFGLLGTSHQCLTVFTLATLKVKVDDRVYIAEITPSSCVGDCQPYVDNWTDYRKGGMVKHSWWSSPNDNGLSRLPYGNATTVSDVIKTTTDGIMSDSLELTEL